ncbi:AAA family ATPase [Nocardioides sp. KIGAM211]|uniref:AAA family ATPase n=1 Tax=Nocardioides luti TaxID=2761101 RepID=A0A7X0VBY9_9ACTN|nr:adenylate/guanylate cyclase domain-containing protein [Nocardioides luti]MBB6628935.1 AAA family ATPase [Nocardioides luti]
MSGDGDARTCTSCGLALPASAKFCLECGTPVVAAAPEREVRKTVTLLFTDVTGSTVLGEQLDPESYRGVMGRYFTVSRAAVERHGGTVEKFVGDAVLAVFGVPEVREDDALRAVRAAHELNAAVAALSEELTTTLGVRLEIRTGVNTGSVVTGAARAGGSFATGDAVNTAARLEQAATPGQILLGETTYALVRDAVEVAEVEPVVAKGKAEPVRAFRLVAVDGDAAGRQRRPDAQLIGRVRETRALDDALERTLESGRGHLVTVMGAPGIGKTRLVAEFLERVGGRADVLRGRCVAYGQGITYWPVVQVLRAAAGLEGDESPEVTRHALVQAMSDAPGDALDDEAVDLLLSLLGKGGEPGGSDQTFWAVSRVLEHLAVRRPLVVTVDDLHWAEPTLLELLERVRDETRDLPLLLVCQARPELMEQHPEWGQGSLNATTFGLEPFDEALTATSLASLLGPGVPAEAVSAVAGWSGGNPLFVEEIATHLVESGLLRRTDDGWAVTGDLASAGVPPTVSALLAARLDRLPPDERDLLERASVIGLELTTEQARLLAEPERRPAVAAVLTSLARRDLLRRVRGTVGETWAFRHVMVRDAAYDSLPKATRAELHLTVADYLAANTGQAGAEGSAFVAHHLGRATEYAVLLAPHAPATRALADRAGAAFAEAAQDARLREDLSGAAALLGDGLALPTGARVRRDLAVRLEQVEIFRYDNDAQIAASEIFAATLADADEPPTELDLVHDELSRLVGETTAGRSVDVEAAQALAARAAALARQAGDTRREVMALVAQQLVAAMRARFADLAGVLDEICRIGDDQDRRDAQHWRGAQLLYGPAPLEQMVAWSVRGAADARSPGQHAMYTMFTAIARVSRGDEDGPELVRSADAESEAVAGDEAISLMMRGMAWALAGRPSEAADRLERMVALARSTGDYSYGSTYLAWRALLGLELGEDLAEIVPMADEAASWTAPEDVCSMALVAALKAVIATRGGDLDAADARAAEALAIVDRSDQLWQRADVRRWVSELPRRRGDVEEERRLLTEAIALYDAKQVVTWRADLEARLRELGGTP